MPLLQQSVPPVALADAAAGADLAKAVAVADTAEAAPNNAGGTLVRGENASPPRILLSPPDVGVREREALLAAFDSNWISTAGPAIGAFERAMEERLGRPCVALSSGTAAIHLALRLAGVEPGSVVMCQSFTFVASANPILYERAVPCFIDSEPRTWNMDAELLEEAIRRLEKRGIRPNAVIVVHLYGVPAEIERIAAVCARYGIPLIEDAAEALGAGVRVETGPVEAGNLSAGRTPDPVACHEMRPVGSYGMAAAFSFNGNKTVTTAGGGMLALATENDAERVRKWSTQSRELAPHYEHTELGYNYRMSNLLAALGTAQLAGLEAKVERRRAIARRYRDALSELPGIVMQDAPANSYATHWLSCALLQDERLSAARRQSTRDGLVGYLAAHGIEARPLWKPMHMQPLFRDAPRLGGTVSASLFAEGLCLPSGSGLLPHEQDQVIAAIHAFLGRGVAGELARVGVSGYEILE